MPKVLPLRSGEPRRVGHYRLIGRIEGFTGADGNPDAYLSRSAQGEQVTVTLLGKGRAADGAARDRFTAEARAARRVDPGCVARILDSGLADGRAYLVSEHIPGASLRETVTGEGPLPGAPLLALAIGMAAGLAAIHQAGLVHGALGPDHVILSPAGPRVVHFSVTPPYGAATPAADLLAWALTVMFAAAGRPAVGEGELAALPEPLRSAVSACLSPDPAVRPAARAVLARLLGREESAGLLAEAALRARGAARDPRRVTRGQPAPVRQRPRTREVIWALAFAGCLLAIAGAAWFISLRPGTPRAGLDSAPSPAPGRARIPAVMAGTWAGAVHQGSPVLAVTVQVTLRAGATRAEVAYPALGCSGTLRVLPGTAAALTMAQHITVGRRSCDDGVLTLTPLGHGRLRLGVRRASGPSPGGVLTRAGPPS